MPLEPPVLSAEGFPFKGPTAGRAIVPFQCFEGYLVLPSMHPLKCPDCFYTIAVTGRLPAPALTLCQATEDLVFPLFHHCSLWPRTAGFSRCLPVYVHTPF